MGSILFWDAACQRPYDASTRHEQALGGTEATVSRVADALDAFVVQHNRDTASGRYRPPGRIDGVDAVVVVRDPAAITSVHALYPDARLFLWLHDQMQPWSKRGRRLVAQAPALAASRATIICVSDNQRRGVEATLRRIGPPQGVRALTVYNAVDDALQPDATPVDPDRLLFFSSPNKGLAYSLDAFAAIRRRWPQMQLEVANPGYKLGATIRMPGVRVLGALAPTQLQARVRGALCTFCPNFVLPETFGLVLAESLALGTPVLAYDCGAAMEVVGDPQQVLPVPAGARGYERIARALGPRIRPRLAPMAGRLGLFDDCIARIADWRAGARPQPRLDSKFRLAAVAARWRTLLSTAGGAD